MCASALVHPSPKWHRSYAYVSICYSHLEQSALYYNDSCKPALYYNSNENQAYTVWLKFSRHSTKCLKFCINFYTKWLNWHIKDFLCSFNADHRYFCMFANGLLISGARQSFTRVPTQGFPSYQKPWRPRDPKPNIFGVLVKILGSLSDFSPKA